MGKGRAPCCDKTKVKRGPWSPAEDLRLIAFIQKNGHDNWRSLPKLAGLARCGKSCRLRWINYLRPDVKRGNFTEEEEETIIKLHESMGNKWSKIAAYLPGRTDNEIKNVWNTHLKKRTEQTKIGEEESSKDVSTITSSSSPTPSSSSSSCNKSKRKMEQVLVEEQKKPSCEQNKRIMTESLKDTTTKDSNLNKEVSSSSSMSNESNDVVTKPKSCEDGHIVHDKKSSSEEVNKPAAAATAEEDSNCYNNFLHDIPNLEGDFDLWSMVDDMDNLGPYFQSINDHVVVLDKVVDNKNSSSYLEDEQKKWLKHMESELGLEEKIKEPDDLLMINPAEDDFLGNLVYSQIWS